MAKEKTAILYEIINTLNGKKYIGVTTTSIKKRWSCHVYRLRRGKCPLKFQSEFDQYGESYFLIREIKRGPLPEMFLLEKELTPETVQNGYNTIIGGGDLDERIASSAVRTKKIAEDHVFRAILSEKRRNENLGKKLDQRTKDQISKGNKGKKRTELVKNAIRARHSGEGNPNAGNYKIYCNLLNGIFYTSTELYNLLGMTKSGVRSMFKRKDTRTSNFVKL